MALAAGSAPGTLEQPKQASGHCLPGLHWDELFSV